MSQNLEERVTTWAAPVLEELDLTLYDVEAASGRLRVVVDRADGVGLDEIARCTRRLSRILDEQDPMNGHYTLEVSSPGLERKLRTRSHRYGAVGETVKCKFRDDDGEIRRVEGVLDEVDDQDITILASDGRVRVPHDQVTALHTVFVWPEPRSPHVKAHASRAGKH